MSGGAPVSARSMKRTKAGVSGGAAAWGEAAWADERELLGRPGRGWSAFPAAGAAVVEAGRSARARRPPPRAATAGAGAAPARGSRRRACSRRV